MEITLETKVKDLIPEGYELTDQSFGNEAIHIYYKKKQPKTFEEYCELFEKETTSILGRFELLQYICQDLNISNERIFEFIYKCTKDLPLTNEFAVLRDILPENFIDELIK